jgi:competence protein ComEA
MLHKINKLICCTTFVLTTSILATPMAPKEVQNTDKKPPASIITPVVNDSAKQITPTNINLADADTLLKIKGMSKKKVQAIIDYRTKNGRFAALDDLLKVKCRGIHKKWLESISKFLTV